MITRNVLPGRHQKWDTRRLYIVGYLQNEGAQFVRRERYQRGHLPLQVGQHGGQLARLARADPDTLVLAQHGTILAAGD